ncbi:DarT ssDNA thymidine ADP-ribosyltransferase family protein [Shewanella xiamenensis]|uniref:DarT ssDNA thymidine ADP-ribosyltransferase family protein n=1 Tax=Shewanella xiamenensis TaxID=332186 RepID=UPI00313B4A68
MADIRTQKQLYHLTDIANLESILKNGILPRSRLNEFVDVADPAIVAPRSGLQLENYVPFHFFAKNPFDGRVQLSHPEKEFVLLAVTRELAQNEGWKVIPKHPLASGVPQLLDYEDGIEQIDWDSMNLRDYQDEQSRLTCMA